MDEWRYIFNEDYRNEYREFNEKSTPIIIEFLKELLPKGSVLDVGCGDGRITEELSKLGWCAIGIDSSEGQLAEARKRDGIYIQGDMRQLPFEETFNSAISIFTSFGYFDNPTDDEKTAASAYKAIKPGGMYILDYTPPRSGEEFHTVKHGNFKGKFRNYTKEEMSDLLSRVGFSIEQVLGRYKNEEFTNESPRMIFIAKK